MSVRPIAIPRPSSPLHDRPSARRLLDLDWILVIATLLLIVYGLVMGYSITVEDRSFTGDVGQQMLRAALYAVIGLSAMAVVALVDYAWLGTFAPAIYLGTLGLLAVVLVIGSSTLGATRWVTIAGFKFQPSEFAKVFVIIVLAKWFADRDVRSPFTLVGALAILAVPVGLVFKQPDLGTSLVFFGIFLGMAFVAGARLWHLTALLAAGAAAVPLMWGFLKEYQRARLTVFLDPYSDPQGAGWNIIQSLIAVGSGSLTGKGLTAGTQSPLGYLPIAESDFVFSGLAEDLGFVGAVILFALYVVLLLSALNVARRSRDAFGTYIAGGVAAMLAFQIMVNVGMAVSLMPVTGIPLPFISQGGSSLISICFALGALQAISIRASDGDRRAAIGGPRGAAARGALPPTLLAMRATALLLAVTVASGCGGATPSRAASSPTPRPEPTPQPTPQPTPSPGRTLPPTPSPGTFPPTPVLATATRLPTPPPAAVVPAPPPRAAAFGIRFEPPVPAEGEPLRVIVEGMQPGEALELVLQAGVRPLTATANAAGEYRVQLQDGLRGSTCVTARAGGRTARAPFGSKAACAAADAPLSGPDPAVVGPTQFFSIRVDVPVGTTLAFIGLTGPDGRRHADYGGEFGWRRVVTERPSHVIQRFSPEYERAGPLPAGVYVWSFEVNGRRYDFRVTLAR